MVRVRCGGALEARACGAGWASYSKTRLIWPSADEGSFFGESNHDFCLHCVLVNAGRVHCGGRSWFSGGRWLWAFLIAFSAAWGVLLNEAFSMLMAPEHLASR